MKRGHVGNGDQVYHHQVEKSFNILSARIGQYGHGHLNGNKQKNFIWMKKKIKPSWNLLSEGSGITNFYSDGLWVLTDPFLVERVMWQTFQDRKGLAFSVAKISKIRNFENHIPPPYSEKSTQPRPLKNSPSPAPSPHHPPKTKKIHPLPKIQTETAKTIKAVWSTALTIRWTDRDYFQIKLFVSTSLIKPNYHGQDQNKNSTRPAKKPVLITPHRTLLEAKRENNVC
jgi:hypothetical protein